MAVLDEKGFVFLDDNGKPFWCRLWEGEAWMFYWHPDKRWVSIKRCIKLMFGWLIKKLYLKKMQIFTMI